MHGGQGTPPEVPPAPPALRKRALVVDDLPLICDMVEDVLVSLPGLHVEVDKMVDTLQAIRALETHTYDLVVADHRLRAGNGLQVLAAARELSPNAGRILMTGYVEIDADPAILAACSIDAYLQKPFHLESVEQMFLDFLRNNRTAIAIHRCLARALEKEESAGHRLYVHDT
jgi:two-component system, probable response regulator PhcQ